ncbi:MAG TPA: carbohydrate binding family 9 domain-containing protein, partial [Hanamia sp.]|nr:carbohydrate binding family 9 domain-containing protein [Hanamia sp.]
MTKLFFSTILLFIFPASAFTQTKTISAIKLNQFIKVDGNPDDEAWNSIPAVSEFVTSTPVFGTNASRKTEVKITYDNTAVYVLAYLYDEPKKIKRHLTERDQVDENDVDVFSIGIDTYNDKQNAFTFKVSAAGVQEDAKVSAIEDVTWNAVWE